MVENIKCPVGKENIGLSFYGKAPCELCALIESKRKEVSEAAKQLEQAYERMKKEFAKLNKMHFKCAGCGLCFGEKHIAFSRTVPGIDEVCQWCAQEIKKRRLVKFKERLVKGGKQDEVD